MEIVTATLDHLDDLTPLFDAYRVFYEQPSNLERARSFLRERMYLRESVLFLAYADSRPVGFTQLYPSFSSVSTQRLWILNDLYVAPDMRGQRVGERLIERAARFSAEFGAKGLLLSTAITNASGQRLYERVGFVREEAFYEYFLKT
jgi:GNAT superfamily N-acetyltransferase